MTPPNTAWHCGWPCRLRTLPDTVGDHDDAEYYLTMRVTMATLNTAWHCWWPWRLWIQPDTAGDHDDSEYCPTLRMNVRTLNIAWRGGWREDSEYSLTLVNVNTTKRPKILNTNNIALLYLVSVSMMKRNNMGLEASYSCFVIHWCAGWGVFPDIFLSIDLIINFYLMYR